jgi:DNA replication and repair protein RecF
MAPDKLQRWMKPDYTLVSGIEIDIDLTYDSICEDYSSPEIIAEQYRAKLAESREKEIEREQTLVGPHRDEVTFYLQGLELRKFGSQGQHRLFALAIKLAQLHFYSDELDDLPILLLDDVFGDLDPKKIAILMKALQQHQGQIFITSANRELFKDHVRFDGEENRLFYVEGGKAEAST